ncbi:hypothetical protein [Candidatus Alkanophaga liquidiphilum]|nr:hypothetical protein [Candidatus Alkanophaga liquidiphilum]RLG36849.1 MAG: hypothetical protein DRN91_06950 [Candidatus Alkanophagales archaeon]
MRRFRLVLRAERGKCVETVAKHEYWRAVDEYMRLEGAAEELELKIELLRKFLEEMDIRRYRAELEELQAKGEDAFLMLELDENGRAHARIETR